MKNKNFTLVLVILLYCFIYSQASFGGNTAIYELHPNKCSNPKIIKDTIENTYLVVLAKIEEKNISRKYDQLVFQYFYDDREGYSDKDVDIWERDLEDFYLKKNKDRIDSQIQIKTNEISGEINSVLTTVFLNVKGNNSDVLGADSKEFNVHKELQVIPKGRPEVVGKSQWKKTSGEISGGLYGTHTTYSENNKLVKKRDCKISSSVQITLALVNVGLGVDVQEVLSSEKASSLQVGGEIPANEKGIWYRRYEEVRIKGKIIKWDNTGKQVEMGEVIVSDYHFVAFLRRTKNGIWEVLPK